MEIYTNRLVSRITQSVYAIKLDSTGSIIVQNKDAKCICDCGSVDTEFCEHIYAAQLQRMTNQITPLEVNLSSEEQVKCRYCGSIDVNRCGFRYNARGISRR